MFKNINILLQVEIIFRLTLAGILGGIIGYERESESKPAGFRTTMLICIGSALTMIISEFLFTKYVDFTNMDPARLGAQVISGVGLICAGTIIREGSNVKGLTTAAGLWVVACVGLAVGIGFYLGAIITTVFVYLILITVKKIQEKFIVKCKNRLIIIRAIDKPILLGLIGLVYKKYNISIENIELSKIDNDKKNMFIKIYSNNSIENQKLNILTELMSIEGVENVSEA